MRTPSPTLAVAFGLALPFAIVVTVGCGDSGPRAPAAGDTSEGGDEVSPDAADSAASLGDTTPNAGPDGGDDGTSMEPAFLPTSCTRITEQACDLRDGRGCELGAGQTCDLAVAEGGQVLIACFDGPNDAGLGGSCDSGAGPFCGAGLTCLPAGSCARFCCENAECGANERCDAFAPGESLGVCVDEAAPSCAPRGAFCRVREDCCSLDCHGDHCH